MKRARATLPGETAEDAEALAEKLLLEVREHLLASEQVDVVSVRPTRGR